MVLCWNRLCCVLILINIVYANQVQIKDNAYEDIVIEIRDDVPEHLCHELIHNIEVSLQHNLSLFALECIEETIKYIKKYKKIYLGVHNRVLNAILTSRDLYKKIIRH